MDGKVTWARHGAGRRLVRGPLVLFGVVVPEGSSTEAALTETIFEEYAREGQVWNTKRGWFRGLAWMNE